MSLKGITCKPFSCHQYPPISPMPHFGIAKWWSAHDAVACWCLLLAACLHAKLGRSSLNTEKGYETKIGSTGSATLDITLILTHTK